MRGFKVFLKQESKNRTNNESSIERGKRFSLLVIRGPEGDIYIRRDIKHNLPGTTTVKS